MKWHMNANHERMLVASLVGLAIVSAAAFAVGPANAAGYQVETSAKVSGVAWWDQLNVRKWPAFYSQRLGALAPQTDVWVERCITVEHASDWCRIDTETLSGWVNSRFLVSVTPESHDDF